MESKITAAYFKCDTKKGNELYIRTKDMLENLIIGGRKIEVNRKENTPLAAAEAYLCDDIVIFDASLEDGDENEADRAGMQYDAMIEPMKTASHVLIVSRSQIPFNVVCVRKGGYPKYIRTGMADYKEYLDNEEILLWIEKIFREEAAGIFQRHKFDRHKYQGLTEKEKTDVLFQMIKENHDNAKQDFQESGKVFVSYLSRYSKFYSGQKLEYTVEDLIAYISKSQKIPLGQIGYFPPGNLSRELMTLQRRWEIISVTDDFIRECSQFWILASPGYLESWWTLSERMTLSYIFAKKPESCPDIYVAKYNSKNGGFQVEKYLDADSKKKFLPKISDDLRREMAVYFSNSRPEEIGYESINSMKIMHYLPAPAIRFLSRKGYEFAEEIMPKLLDELGETKEDYVRKSVQSARSFVYTNSFWEDWIMECPVCKKKNGSIRYQKETFLKPQKNSFCHVVKKQDFRREAGRNRYSVICKSCGHKFYFTTGFFYRWYPIRGEGMRTGPGGKTIEKKLAYYFEKDEREEA